MSQPDIPAAHLIKASQFLFDEFCEQNNVPLPMRHMTSQMAFFDWLPEATAAYSVESFASQLEITEDAARFMLELPHKSYGMNQMISMWPYMCLGRRPCKHEVTSFNLMFVTTWSDGTVCPISMFVHKATNVDPLKDAEAVHMLITRPSDLAEMIKQQGLDALHDNKSGLSRIGHPDTLNALQRLIEKAPEKPENIKTFADAVVYLDSMPALTLQERADLHALMTYIRAQFPTELPAHIQRQLDARTALEKQPANGGFDDKGSQ